MSGDHIPPRKQQYEGTVEVDGVKYDVYWFKFHGKQGQVAFSQTNGVWEIVLFRAGRYALKTVEAEIAQSLKRKQQV